MKKIIAVGLLFSLTTAFTPSATETEVYICPGSSKRYHFHSSCRGLSRCSTTPKKVTLSAAKRMGRTLCGWED